MPRKSKVLTLPPELKEWLDAELVRRGFADYVQLAADLKGRGAEVSKSALQRYGAPFERQLARVKMATEQAVALVDAAPDEEDKLSSAVIRITQEKILNLLMDLDIDGEDVDVNKLFKSTAEIVRASAANKKSGRDGRAALREEARRELLEEQAARLQAMPVKPGVTAETLAEIRRTLGIV